MWKVLRRLLNGVWSQLALLIPTAALCSRHGGVVLIGLHMVAGGAPPTGTAQGLQMKILGTELTLAQGLGPQTLGLCRQGCPLH